VVAVLALGLQHLERGGDEHGVVAPGGEQFVLPGLDRVGLSRWTRRTINRPCTWSCFGPAVSGIEPIAAVILEFDPVVSDTNAW